MARPKRAADEDLIPVDVTLEPLPVFAVSPSGHPLLAGRYYTGRTAVECLAHARADIAHLLPATKFNITIQYKGNA